jgi:phosphatidylinositol dimannoside acyltransferase
VASGARSAPRRSLTRPGAPAIDTRIVTHAYRGAAALARNLPLPFAEALSAFGGWAASETMEERRFLVRRNLQRICGPELQGARLEAAVRGVFGSYSRYWVESARLPTLSDEEIDEGHDVTGYEHVEAALRAGRGIILVLPHLGGWEWSAFWLARICGVRVSAVVEPLQPPELFDWFIEYRRSLGMNIIPLGPRAGAEVLSALNRNEVVCLLADRDVSGGGMEVDFFGERTTLPAGPATVALRARAPLCPTAVYFRGRRGHRGVVRPPLEVHREGRLRDDVQRLTQEVTAELEVLIRAAPVQWHLMQPNWPSDHRALARRRAATP